MGLVVFGWLVCCVNCVWFPTTATLLRDGDEISHTKVVIVVVVVVAVVVVAGIVDVDLSQ